MEEFSPSADFTTVRRVDNSDSIIYWHDLFARIQEEEAGVASYSLFVEARK